MIKAEIIKDSIFRGSRLISIRTFAPKFLDAEIEKHRMISSNSSSSRAIPVNKNVLNELYIPRDVRLNESGMQGYSKLDSSSEWFDEVASLGSHIRELVIRWSNVYSIHKQHLNRYLEPFTMQSKIMTANYEWWAYFLKLRKAPDADPAIQELAHNIERAIKKSTPVELEKGMWHLPFVDSYDYSDVYKSVARCARVSYGLFDDNVKPSASKDAKLYKHLISAGHMTPLEHQATPINIFSKSCSCYKKGIDIYSGNFKNWCQYRQMKEYYEV